MFVHNALVATGLRGKIKIAASGKVSSAFSIARNLAIGADWCNAARGFMMAVGCVQAQTCHTNRCPVGVATQDPFANVPWTYVVRANERSSFIG